MNENIHVQYKSENDLKISIEKSKFYLNDVEYQNASEKFFFKIKSTLIEKEFNFLDIHHETITNSVDLKNYYENRIT